MKELEYIHLWILPAVYLNTVCNISTTLFETGCTIRVNPENPSLGRLITKTKRVFNSKLRFPSELSAFKYSLMILKLTLRRLNRLGLFWTPFWLLQQSDRAVFRDQRNPGRGKMGRSIEDSVESLVALVEGTISQLVRPTSGSHDTNLGGGIIAGC